MLVFTGDINLTDWYFNAGFGIGTRIANGFAPFVSLKEMPMIFGLAISKEWHQM